MSAARSGQVAKKGGAKYSLVISSGDNRGKEIVVAPGKEFCVGRSREVEISINDEGASRRHAIFFMEGDQLMVEDLGSINGTMVNRTKVQRTVLKDGDRVRIGRTTLLVAGTVMSVSQESKAWWEQTEGNIATMQLPPKAAPAARPAAGAAKMIAGSLAEIPLLDLLQLLANSTKTGIVTIRCKPDTGRIHLVDGRIVRATLNDQPARQPERMVYRLLRWSQGTFDFSPAAVDAAADGISLPTQTLLMEGAHQVDEIARLEGAPPALSAKLKVARPLPGRLRELSDQEIDVFQSAYEHGTVMAVLDDFELSDAEVYGLLLELIKRGYVTAG